MTDGGYKLEIITTKAPCLKYGGIVNRGVRGGVSREAENVY